MKIYSINERMPYVACLHEVSSENDKKVRRFRLGHLMFTVQLHSREVDDFDKKSIYQKEQLLKEKLPKKIRESLSTANHAYDSKLTADLAASADKIHAQREKLEKMRDDVLAARAEAEAEAAKAKAEAEANAKAAAEAEALNKMLDAMLTARGIPAVPSAEGQQTADADADTAADAAEDAAKAKAADEATKRAAAEEKRLRDVVDAAREKVNKLKAKLGDGKLTGNARDSVNEEYRKALEAYIAAGDKLASFVNATI